MTSFSSGKPQCFSPVHFFLGLGLTGVTWAARRTPQSVLCTRARHRYHRRGEFRCSKEAARRRHCNYPADRVLSAIDGIAAAGRKQTHGTASCWVGAHDSSPRSQIQQDVCGVSDNTGLLLSNCRVGFEVGCACRAKSRRIAINWWKAQMRKPDTHHPRYDYY